MLITYFVAASFFYNLQWSELLPKQDSNQNSKSLLGNATVGSFNKLYQIHLCNCYK